MPNLRFQTVLLIILLCSLLKAELRATEAERSVTKLQKEVDRLEGKITLGNRSDVDHE